MILSLLRHQNLKRLAVEAVEGQTNRDGMLLESQRQMILKQMKGKIGSRQVTHSSLEFWPNWILDQALNSELTTNWKGVYTTVHETCIPHGANVISSHIVFKTKDDEDGNLKLKARLVLHGNRDRDRFSVRRDSASVDLSVVRIVLSLASILDFKVATADVTEAYMHQIP